VVAIAATVALAAGLSVVASPADAAPLPLHDNSNETVQCNDVIGKIKFQVPLVLGGATPNNVTFTFKSYDCINLDAGVYDASVNPTGTSIKGMSGKGIVTSPTNDCLGLNGLSSISGSVPLKWTTNPQTPKLTQTSSTLSITSTWGGQFNDGGVTSPSTASNSWGANYAYFAIGGPASSRPLGSGESFTANPTVTGGFTGGNNGNGTTFMGTSAESSGTAAARCFSTGLKGIQFGIGGTTIGDT
jgi:hypothetical protein